MGFSLFKKKKKKEDDNLGNQVPDLKETNNTNSKENIKNDNEKEVVSERSDDNLNKKNFENNNSHLPNLPNFEKEKENIESDNKKNIGNQIVNNQNIKDENLSFPQKSEFELNKNKLNYSFEEESHKNLLETKLLESALKQRSPYNIKAPLFITINKYRELLKEITASRDFLEGCEDLKFKEIEILEKQEKYYDSLRNNIEDLQRRFLYMDKKLFEENNA